MPGVQSARQPPQLASFSKQVQPGVLQQPLGRQSSSGSAQPFAAASDAIARHSPRKAMGVCKLLTPPGNHEAKMATYEDDGYGESGREDQVISKGSMHSVAGVTNEKGMVMMVASRT